MKITPKGKEALQELLEALKAIKRTKNKVRIKRKRKWRAIHKYIEAEGNSDLIISLGGNQFHWSSTDVIPELEEIIKSLE